MSKFDTQYNITEQGQNSFQWKRGQNQEEITVDSLNAESTADLLPANSEIIAIATIVTAALTGGTHAVGTITMGGIATADETFVIDTQTFTWKASRSGAGEVTIGADAAAAVANIVTAVTADLATVTAADGTGDTVVVTAVAGGVAGNSIVFTEGSTNMTVDGSNVLGGTTAGVDVVNFTIGEGLNAGRFMGTNTSIATGDKAIGMAHRQGGVATDAMGAVQTAAAKIRIEPNVVPDTGKILVTVYYEQFVAGVVPAS